MMKYKKQIIKIIFLMICFGIYYCFIPQHLTAWLYPWQCKGIIRDINPNLFHIPAYIVMGYCLKWYSLIFAFGGEMFQVLILKRSFGWQDTLFNIIGMWVGIILWKIERKSIRITTLIITLIAVFLGIIFS